MKLFELLLPMNAQCVFEISNRMRVFANEFNTIDR